MKNVSAPARRFVCAAVLILTCIILALGYASLHNRVIVSSDTTTTFPMSSDLLAGNGWLKNWILGSNNFYFTEICIYALGHLAGLSYRTLTVWVPSLALALTFSLLLAFLLPELEQYKRVISYIIFALLFAAVLLIVPYLSSYALLSANSHNNLYALVAVSFLLVAAFMDGHLWALLILIFLGSCLCFSEGVTLMVLVGPLVLFGLLRAVSKKQGRPLLLTLAGALMYAGGKAISALFDHLGGLVTRGIPMHLVHLNEVPGRAEKWGDEFAALLGTSLLTRPVTVYKAFAWCAAILFTASILYGIVRFFLLSWRRQFLLLAALLNIGGCLFTDVAITYRYIVPAFYFGFLLLFLFISDAVEHVVNRAAAQAKVHTFSMWRAAAGLLVSFSTVFSVCFGADKWTDFVSKPAFGSDEQRLADFIQEQKLGDGYANFWNASVIAYYADFDFQVYPVYTGTGSGTFIAYPELIRRDWYAEKGIHYFVLHEDGENSEILQQVITIAGEPDTTYSFGSFDLLWYEKDLSGRLTNGMYDNVLTPEEILPVSMSGIQQEDDGWTLTDGGSVATYGVSLAPGTWKFTFRGENLGNASLAITSEKLGSLAEFSPETDPAPEDSGAISLTFTLPKVSEDITVTVTDGSGEEVILNQITSEEQK